MNEADAKRTIAKEVCVATTNGKDSDMDKKFKEYSDITSTEAEFDLDCQTLWDSAQKMHEFSRSTKVKYSIHE